jgi:hypothetical protein
MSDGADATTFGAVQNAGPEPVGSHLPTIPFRGSCGARSPRAFDDGSPSGGTFVAARLAGCPNSTEGSTGVRLTDEQQAWRKRLREQVAGVNCRARVTTDAEGWAYVPGRLGQVEVTTDLAWLAVYTTRTRQVPKLLAVPALLAKTARRRQALVEIDALMATCVPGTTPGPWRTSIGTVRHAASTAASSAPSMPM